MTTRKPWAAAGVAAGSALGALAAMRLSAYIFESSSNKTRIHTPYPVRPEAAELHQSLFIADLHADALLWNRNLLRRHAYGHVDLPRLIDGNVAFQVFGLVTKSPKGQNFQHNAADTDNITLLAVLQHWPPRTWGSLLERALYQAGKLRRFASRSEGRLMVIRSQADLDCLLARRKAGEAVVGGFPGLEGVHALEGRSEGLDRLFEAGVRMVGMAHFFDNEAGGSAHGLAKGGLTPFGRQVVRGVQARKMILDLAHAAPAVIDDALELAEGPVIVSHTGVRGTSDNVRNLSDNHVRRIAATGGVMGIAMFDPAVGGPTLADTARAMRYTADLVGVDHIALGSDFDGVVTTPVDSSGLPLLTQELVDAGFHPDEIAKIMGLNFLRVMRQTLP